MEYGINKILFQKTLILQIIQRVTNLTISINIYLISLNWSRDE